MAATSGQRLSSRKLNCRGFPPRILNRQEDSRRSGSGFIISPVCLNILLVALLHPKRAAILHSLSLSIYRCNFHIRKLS